MTEQDKYTRWLMAEAQKGRMSRRDFLGRSSALGLSMVVGTGLFNEASAAMPKKGGHMRMAMGHGATTDTLDPATLTRISSLDEVGLGRFYRAVSIGSDPSLPEAVPFTNEAASLRPYAPVHIQGSRDGAGDLTITWVRRTRFSGEWRDLIDAPLNEVSETYEVDVLDGTGEVVRTLGTTSPSVVYTAADQTSDFGAPQGKMRRVFKPRIRRNLHSLDEHIKNNYLRRGFEFRRFVRAPGRFGMMWVSLSSR